MKREEVKQAVSKNVGEIKNTSLFVFISFYRTTLSYLLLTN